MNCLFLHLSSFFTYACLSVFVPVGLIWKFDHEKTFSLDFGVKCNFSKIRIEQVMLKLLATTKKNQKIKSEESNYNRGKVVKNNSWKLLFAISDTKFERE